MAVYVQCTELSSQLASEAVREEQGLKQVCPKIGVMEWSLNLPQSSCWSGRGMDGADKSLTYFLD